MKIVNLLALPALLCSALVLAIPSPATDQQRPLERPDRNPHWQWRSLFDKPPNTAQKGVNAPSRQPKKAPKTRSSTKPNRFPPSHISAQYEDDLVLRFNISNAEEAESFAQAADTLMLDIWEYTHNWVDVRLKKQVLPHLLGLLPTSLHEAHVPLLRERELALAIHDTYPDILEKKPYQHERSSVPERRPFSLALEPANGAEDNIFFSDYQPLSVIEPWMRLLASLFTTHVRQVTIGRTYEGRDISGLRVGVHPKNNEDPSPSKRKTVLVAGGLHAREWISTSTVNYIAYSLITGYGKIGSITSMLEAFDFVFLPTLNPDGYVYTWETDRLWRKNRQRTNVEFCKGIDLDRGFGFEWETKRNACAESYAGEKAFEAIEARRLADWAKNETDNNAVEFVGFLDLHSYSQEILYPYSYSCQDPPPGLENLEELAFGLGKAIRMTHNHNYEVMPACEGNVLASTSPRTVFPHIESSGGSALDYFYHTIKTRFAYQIKLRDRGTYGFLLPKQNIIPTGKEILNSILYFGNFLTEVYGEEVGVGKPDLAAVRLDREEEERVGREEEAGEEEWVVVEDVSPEEGHWSLRRRR